MNLSYSSKGFSHQFHFSVQAIKWKLQPEVLLDIIAKTRDYKNVKKFLLTIFGSVFRVTCSQPLVALTFDDGPDPVFTHSLLKILKKYNAKATFFMVGQAAKAHPELLQQVFNEGHCIGNHGWDHISMARLSMKDCMKQIRKCSHSLGSYESSFFRPPFGHQTLLSALITRLMGYKIVGGDVIPLDWTNASSEEILLNLKANIKPGSIVILHDRLFMAGSSSKPDRTETLVAVEKLFSSLGSDFQFVTIKDLLAQGRPELKLWTYLPS